MAYVNIYPEHLDLLNSLITSSKVASSLGSLATGPFKEQRDAYVFAASIGIALGTPTPVSGMPKSKKKDTISIRDTVFLGSEGAPELAATVLLIQDLGEGEDTDVALREQLDQVASGDLGPRLELLDRYAHAGFSWLSDYDSVTGTVRDLVMEVIDKVSGVDYDPEDLLIGSDPLASFLLS